MEDVVDVVQTGTYDVDEDLFLLWCDGMSVDQSVRSSMDKTLRALTTLRTPVQHQAEIQTETQQQTKPEEQSVPELTLQEVPDTADPLEELRLQASSDSIGSITEESMLAKLLQNEITDQWRLFEMIEHFLQTPLLFANCSYSFHMIPDLHMQQCLRMIHGYYSFDNSVAQELVGKKITNKGRRDIDDVSETTNIPMRSCKRQLENVRRVFTSLEDSTQFQCNVFQYLSQQYLLGPPQALRYTALLFLLYARFQVYNKRKLQRLDYDDLEYCAAVVLNCIVNDGQSFVESRIDEGKDPLQVFDVHYVIYHTTVVQNYFVCDSVCQVLMHSTSTSGLLRACETLEQHCKTKICSSFLSTW